MTEQEIMKELSIEEKAKRYDELKVTAQELEHDGCFDKITLFDLFPELKENEDEKTRKELLGFCKNRAEYYPNDPKYKNISAWIAWLEKQGEKESVTCPICGWEIEKQGEQKPVEPKFKVGDWVVWDNKISCHIDNIYQGKESLMYTITDTNNMTRGYSVKGFDNNAHLWTIQDAKDGDVLYTPKGCGVEGIFLIEGWKQVGDTGRTLCSNIGYRVEDDEIIAGGLGAIWWKGVIDPFYPATKEQRDLLFQKMEEAGYEWDDVEYKYIKL